MKAPITVTRAGTQAVVPEYMFYREAAAYCGVSVDTLKLWKDKGFLPAYKQGPLLVVFRREDLDAIPTLIVPSGAKT